MKFLAALLLVVASVHSNSLHYYGWAPGKEMVFHYQSQVLTGIPEISQSHWSGLKMNAKVTVQSYSDYSMRLRISEPEFLTINGENVKLSETGRVLREQGSDSVKTESLTEEFKRFLIEPFMVNMKAGVVESLLVSKNEPASVTNIKKSILSQIQMDVAGTRRTELETNQIQLPVSEEGVKQLSYFTTMEESVQGECKTEYTIHRLPQWKINELEEAWRMEELKVKDFNIESESEAKTICKGKPYYLITKTRYLDQCKKTPFFQMYTRDTLVSTDMTSSSELGMTVSTTNTFVCGELNEFIVRKVAHKRVTAATITGYKTEERATSPSQVNMSLLKIRSITSRLNVPTTTVTLKSLVYGYPLLGSGHEELNQEIVEKTEELLGLRPLMPQPGLTTAPHNLILDLNNDQIIPQILETVEKMAREIYQSPESCASKSDLAGKLSTVSMYLRTLTLPELEQLERQVLNGSKTTGMKSMEKIFYDILSLVGTNPSTMLIIKKVKEGSLPSTLLTKIVSYAIRNIRYPTQEIMEELVQMLRSSNVRSNKQLYTASMLQVSNLFYHAYVNPITMRNNFPTKVFGVFGTKNSQVLTEKFIPLLVEEIERTESEHVRLSAILALGKTGHLKGLKTLVKEIEHASIETTSATKVSMTEARRTIAVNAMKRIAKMNPIETRPILMSIIVNPVESTEVRIAAIAVLPFSQPTTAEIQKLAIRSWVEPSRQVSSFIVSTLRSLAYTHIPELKIVGLKARSVLPLIKNEQYGIQYSHNINYSSFVDYLRLLINNQYQLVNSKESLIPHKVSLKTVYYGPSNSIKVPAIEFSAYTYGMDFLLEKYLHFFSTEEQTTSTIREQLNKISEELRLKTREISTPFSFLFNSWGGIESTMYLDSQIVMESLEQLTSKFESGHEVEFNHVGSSMLFDTTYMFVTETGFPILATSSMPLVYSLKGSLMVSPMEGKMMPRINGKFIPVLNGKLVTRFGVISPFTKEVIGSGVDMSVHSSLPLELEGKMTQGQIELSVRIPSETQRSGKEVAPFHGFVLPYTFKHNLLRVAPVSQLKKIVSGIMRQPVKMEIGQSLGLSGRFVYQSDAQFVDIVSYIQKIVQHTPLTIIPSAVFPSSVRRSSMALVLNPAQSQTKEFTIIVGLSTKGMMHSLSKKMITEHQISSQFSQVQTVLSQLEKANIVEITGMTKGSSGSELQKIQSIIVLGKKSSGISSSSESHLAVVEVSPINGQQSYALRYEGKIEIPQVMNRWNVERLVEESLRGGFQGELFFGKSNQMESFKVVAELEKTEELKREIRESPEFKKCMAEQHQNELLTPTCTMVRREAASLDKIHLTFKTPKSWSETYFMTLLDSVSKGSLVLGNVESEQPYHGTEGLLKVEARAERTSQLATYVKVLTPTREVVLRNFRLAALGLGHVFPSTILSTPMEVAALRMSANYMPSTCRVEPSFIRTFDNMTVDYKINDCEHVLLLDGSKHIPVSVIAKTVESEKKIVKILSGITEVKMIPVSGSMKVMVNGEELRLPTVGQKLIKKNTEGKILVIVQHFQDGVVSVHVPEQGLKVLSNGSRIEVVAPQVLKSRTVGLCGDMNGERTADLKTPHMCVMRPRLAAFSFMLNKSGSASGFERCSGLPAAIKPEFERETTKCSRETIIPTPVSRLYERISFLNKPTGMTHIVDKQSTQLCISKQMVKTCLSKPLSIKQKSVEFVCVPQPSVMARSLEKRALSGESLFQEISQLPTVFRKVEFEPVACKSEMSSISL